jgi:ubiquitin-protein ligase
MAESLHRAQCFSVVDSCLTPVLCDSLRWIITLDGVPDTLYAGEHFELQVDFPEHYPMEAPQVRDPSANRFRRTKQTTRKSK